MTGFLLDNLVLIATVTFFVLMCVRGYNRGLIRMITSFVGMAVSLFVARYFMPRLTERMEENPSWVAWVQAEVVPKLKVVTAHTVFSVLSFLAIFVVTLVLIKILCATLDKLAEVSILRFLNEALGLVLGAAEAMIYIWIFMIVVQVLPHVPLFEEISRQIAADGLLSILSENNLLAAFLAGLGQ